MKKPPNTYYQAASAKSRKRIVERKSPPGPNPRNFTAGEDLMSLMTRTYGSFQDADDLQAAPDISVIKDQVPGAQQLV
jgi:hypothetical protein